MENTYYVGIKDQKVGPLNEKAVREKIEQGVINGKTLAWRQGMEGWKSIDQIPELMAAVGKLLSPGAPPPLPSGASTPPPLPQGPSDTPQGLSSLEATAYRFVTWGPKRGPNLMRSYVEKNPKMALPVAAVVIVCCLLMLVFFANSMAQNKSQMAQGQGQQGFQQPGMPNPNWQAQYQAIQDANRFSSQVSDEVYKYKRDADDRMSETYRRGTYDWYNKDDD